MTEQINKVPIDELETSDYDVFKEVTYRGEMFTGIGFDETPTLYSEYRYKDGKGDGKCFTITKTGQKIEEFELSEGEYIGEGYEWYPNGQLKEYNRYTATRLMCKWNESGVLLLEDDGESKIRKEFYSTGELKLEYRKYIDCNCYSKEGDWIFKHKYQSGSEYLIFCIEDFIFNDQYIFENYNEILHEDTLQNDIFLWLKNVLCNDNTKAIKIICNLFEHENLHTKNRAILIAGENKIREAKPFLIKALDDKRIPPTIYDFINGGAYGCTRTIRQQAKIALDKLR